MHWHIVVHSVNDADLVSRWPDSQSWLYKSGSLGQNVLDGLDDRLQAAKNQRRIKYKIRIEKKFSVWRLLKKGGFGSGSLPRDRYERCERTQEVEVLKEEKRRLKLKERA